MSQTRAASWPPGPRTISLAEFLSEIALFSLDEATAPISLLDRLAAINDPIDRRIIDDLILEYRQAGRFNTPLRVEDGELTNGYHRLAALLDLNAPTVDIWVVHDGLYEPRPYNGLATEVIFLISTPAPTPLDDTYLDALWAARSVPGPKGWIESDGPYGLTHDEKPAVSYEYYAPEDVVRAALDTLVARFALAGLTVTVASVSPVRES